MGQNITKNMTSYGACSQLLLLTKNMSLFA